MSESTKFDLSHYYHLDPINIQTIYSGVVIDRPSNELLEEFRLTHDLPKRFVLSLGTLEPRKNIQGIIQAFNRMKEIPGFEDVWLVIAGDRGWLDGDIFAEIERSPFSASC